MNSYIIKIEHTGLGSRASAASVRREVEKHLRSGEVAIDLSAVTSISSSYADELFGILVQQHSLGVFSGAVKLVGVSPLVLTEIATAIQYRLNQDAGDQSAADRAAQNVLAERERLAVAS